MPEEKKKEKKEPSRLEIYTLGNFLVKRGDHLLSKDANRAQRLWSLFKYLITNRGKSVLPEDLMETLWPEEEGVGESTLRTLVYRLRRMLNGEADQSKVQHIISSQGCYIWNTQAEYWLDAEVFEECCIKAHNISEENSKEAEALYMQAFEIYKGDYLPEYSYQEWVVPLSNYYRRLYLECVFALVEGFQKEKRYGELCKVCEKVFLIEPFEEELHQIYIESLLKEGKTKQAQAHYESITAALYREMGAKPSPALRDLYRKIKNNDGSVEMDLSLVQENLMERKAAGGAFLGDPDTFRFLYKLESRRAARSGQVVFVALITMTKPDYSLPHSESLNRAMQMMQNLLMESLRRGDVITKWNEAQFLALLPGLNFEQAKMVLERIESFFNKYNQEKEIILRGKVQPLQLFQDAL